ncbi:cytosine deaminase [Glaciihabitans tibetensis]|uniref:Cytosine deaminase n=1 Tax=Glaciihabitans tibetensis TaxID=1266600 RepID=A0A2T0VFT2_9MICO|nr:amidohydrolase family protein [Glaciihabitans tibetensis]PRY69077.1 cytosine deaminase [Glaciihabitans tibetensis]
MNLPRPISLLRNATLPDGREVDVAIHGGVVTEVSPAGSAPSPVFAGSSAAGSSADGELDLEGYLLLPATADPHAHLDKARSWDAIRPPLGDLMSAIFSWREYTATMSEADVADRARTQALSMLRQGTTAIRSHVDILRGDDPLLASRALLRVRDELSGLMDIELVVLAGPDVPDAQVEAALDLGIDLVGGAPHLAADPLLDLRRLLAIAERRGAGVDLHTDESLAGPVTLEALALAVRGWNQNVSAGHCVRLGTMDTEDRTRVIAEVVASKVGIIANPITNLYLQGWDNPTATPRGLTAARELIDAGARFAAGADNVRDPFNPLGSGDALETTMLLVVAGHLTIDEAYTAVSSGAREVMALPAAGVFVGGRADLLAIAGSSLIEVVADAPAARMVFHNGLLVAVTSVESAVASPTAASPDTEPSHIESPATASPTTPPAVPIAL